MTPLREGMTQHRHQGMPTTDFIVEQAKGSTPNIMLLLAHGSGAPMDSDYLQTLTGLLAMKGVTVARFEFDYMAQRRNGGKRRPPPKMDVLIAEYRGAVAELQTRYPHAPLLIGGKSMGGRVASMIADEVYRDDAVKGCVCLGYPFHPVKRPLALRTAHLVELRCPTLIVQGDRDPFGTRDDIANLRLSDAVAIGWIADGDHDFKPRAASSLTHAQNLEAAAASVAAWAEARLTD